MGFFDIFKSRPKGIESSMFDSQQYQTEILALGLATYLEKKHSYAAVEKKLASEGLSDAQCDIIINRLKKHIAGMVNDFETELESGRIEKITIQPNPDHIKGKADKDQVDRYIGYGAFQLERGEFENALELFDKAIELDDRATLAYANKGSLYAQKGDTETAMVFYNKALELEPRNLRVLENKMDLLLEMVTDEASEVKFIDTVKTILSHDPEYANALIYIIQFDLKRKNFDSALRSVKVLFRQHYSEHIAIQLLVDVFLSLPYERAMDEFASFEQELSATAQYQMKYCQGIFLKSLQRYDEAIALFDKLNHIDKFSWNFYQMAIIKHLQQQDQETLALLKETFALEPELKADAKQFPELREMWNDPEFIKITS